MKGILYYEKEDAARNDWFINELIKAGQVLGVDMRLETESLRTLKEDAFLFYRGRDFEWSRKWESEGIRVINRSEVNRIANDKLQSAQLGAMLGIPVIPTKQLNSVETIHSYPVVVKTASGYGGTDVHLCQSANDAMKLLEQYERESLIVQPYLEHGNSDVRLYVIGNEVVGGVKRTGLESFKANVSLGGTTERFDAPAPLRRFAEKIAQALKSDYI